MIIELIEFAAGELNSDSGIVKTITDSEITSITYGKTESITANSMSVLNGSGETIHFVPMTGFEYDAYVTDHTITQLIPLANSSEKVLDNMEGEISKIMCSGVTGHTDGVTFVFYKD
jgi:hypothetical protein